MENDPDLSVVLWVLPANVIFQIIAMERFLGNGDGSNDCSEQLECGIVGTFERVVKNLSVESIDILPSFAQLPFKNQIQLRLRIALVLCNERDGSLSPDE